MAAVAVAVAVAVAEGRKSDMAGWVPLGLHRPCKASVGTPESRGIRHMLADSFLRRKKKVKAKGVNMMVESNVQIPVFPFEVG